MTLRPGSRLGAYEIVDLIGEGGMGVVYRALDPRLGREVAIKVVRPALAEDPNLLSRFEREARLLASLSHPHIATVHGLEEADGVRFLVLELVPGTTLAQRLQGGALPLEDALVTAGQIAAAMESAHDRGVIHRDLKPANIKLVPGIGVKVLDFGLAKALGVDPKVRATAEAPTALSGATQLGTVLGTAAYMSPEQARGQDVDKRTDVWAFGCVLFDMLTGKPAFAGDTLSDTIANVLTREPNWDLLPREVPGPIRRLLRRCLHKDAHRRLRDIGDARLEIEEALSGRADEAADATSTSPVPLVTRPRRRTGQVALLLAGAALGSVVMWVTGRDQPPALPTAQFSVALPSSAQLGGLDFPAVALAPDAGTIVYVGALGGSQQLYVHTLASMESAPLDGTEGASSPFFSPDGQWIAFFADGKLKKVPVSGGTVRIIADAPLGLGGSWGPDGTIVYAPSNSSTLWRVSAEGGTPAEVTRFDEARGEFSHRWPEFLPDGSGVLFTAGGEGSWDDAQIELQPLNGGKRTVLVHGGTNPRHLQGRRFLYAHGGSVFLATLDARAGRLEGEPTQVLQGVLQSVDGAGQYAVSVAGSLLFAPGGPGEHARTLAWVDRRGNTQPLPAPPRAYGSPRLSPDGQTLAVTITDTREDLWTYDIAADKLARLTHDGGTAPTWSSDGSRIFFSAARDGPLNLFVKRADGSGVEERLTRSERMQMSQSLSPDGTLAFVESDPAGGRDIALLTWADRRSRPFVATLANETAPALSPDGRWVAYASDEAGDSDIYVADVSDPARRVRVSRGGGTEPVWRRDGLELLYRWGPQVFSVNVSPGPKVEAPRLLFEGAFASGTGGRAAYDVSPDGARLIMVRPGGDDPRGRELRVILNWQPNGTRPQP